MEKFISMMGEIFEIDPTRIALDDNFKQYEEWNSLIQLTLIAVVFDNFNIGISKQDLDAINTFQDLYTFINKQYTLAKFSIQDVQITGIAACIPPTVIRNSDSQIFENEIERDKVIQLIGIDERRFVDDATTASVRGPLSLARYDLTATSNTPIG